MENREFPNCCGFRILTNFEYADVRSFTEFLKTEEEIYLSDIHKPFDPERPWNTGVGRAGMMLALNGYQNKRFETTLKKLNWTLAMVGGNQPHNSKCFLWVKPEERKKKNG